MLDLEHVLDTRLHNAQVFFVRVQPFLIGVLQRRGQRRHYFATVPKIAANLSPLLLFADTLEATSSLDGFFQLVQIKWALVDTWKSSEIVAVLLVEFG